MPPRSLKTICATKALPAYLITIDPSLEIICASYSHDLAIAHHADFRRIIEASWYREQFPHVRASSGQSGGTNTQTEFRTSANGGRIATSVGGTLTGRGADIIIIDDPSKTDAAMSKADRDTVNAWFSNTVVTRLNNPSNGRIMIVMQRIHEDDLVGHVTDREADRWTILNIPAIAQNDETYQLSDTCPSSD